MRWLDFLKASSKVALIDDVGKACTYRQLDALVREKSKQLESVKARCIAVMMPRGVDFIATMLAVFKSGNVAVPLSLTYPPAMLDYMLKDSGATKIASLKGIMDVNQQHEAATMKDGDALMIYTSGTTGKPKGVVHTHKSIDAMISSLREAWEWSPRDELLHFLPMEHVHGLVNVPQHILLALLSNIHERIRNSCVH